MSKITVLAVDDHPLMLQGIRSTLAGVFDLELIATASTGQEAVQKFKELSPDVTLMDITMPGAMNGTDALIEIRRASPEAKVIMLTVQQGDAQARRAIMAGAASYLLKSSIEKDLLETIRLVHLGKRHVPAEVASELANNMLSGNLSAVEVEVLRLVGAGYTNKLIARKLEVPEETVKSRMKSILAKLSASDRAHAVTIALRRGIIDMF